MKSTLHLGDRFGRLTLLEDVGSKWGYRLWRCLCDCGKPVTALSHNLKRGSTRSCGCLRTEVHRAALLKQNLRHGCAKRGRWTREYGAWKDIKRRCLNPKFKQWKDYGGRGIQVCDRWLSSFENFLADVGLRPSSRHSIDRINNDGNYEPGNVRWATKAEQEANKRPKARAV
jgi:hypothetical protein